MTNHHNRNGFTLLEVLIALTVTAIAMTAAFQVISSSSGSQRKLQDGTFARWVAETEMANMQLGLVKPAVGESSGETFMAGRTWHWQRVVTVAADPTLRRVHVAVSAEDTRETSATLTAFVLADRQK
ncbi:MAG: type II secretion system protein GspI [Gammaproteobacteria bacterium]|nr:MAG: type II secretion system protein GspI [Gammaproteobacteria bacterium]